MIRNLSIKRKIVIWFSLSMLFIVGIMLALTYAISQSVFTTDIQTQLKTLVDTNAEEIEYLNSREIAQAEFETGDHFLSYGNGFLEIDDDFCDYANGVYTCLVDSENNLLYGESPIYLTQNERFTYTEVAALKYNGEKYYVYERPIHGENMEGLWLRGVASMREGTHLLSTIMRFVSYLLPSLALLSVLIGYIITRRSFAPAEKIMETAESITSGNDLSRRIQLPDGKNEFHSLADSYNRMLDRLEESFQREKQFTSDVSHELRTPTAVILSQCEFSLEMAESEEDYREALEVIQKQGLKMKDMISQLLFFSRLEQGREPLQIVDSDLSALVSGICDEQEVLAAQSCGISRTITLSQNISPQVIAPVDRGLFSRVVTNLINNAYKYGKEGGHIEVRLRKEAAAVPDAARNSERTDCSDVQNSFSSSHYVVFQVADDGIGIQAEHLPRIFDRFYQVDFARTASAEDDAGAGLGLSMVREIVRMHGGQIDVESRPGEGSVFTVTLPANG